ncbi:hypothetical protein GCM10023213_47610 [Prosthecobacter algae]|uniref:Tir chaperone family protein CesT n=1 Tax=Prosthecobacter algae TaxID=1144682 RepID=A0ABP9PQI6_9BACT
MSLSEILASLPPELGLQDLASDANGICELAVDDRLKILIEEEPQTLSLHLYSVVASVAEMDAVPAFATVLEAQLFGREIGEGMAFGLDQATSEIVLWRKMYSGNLEPDTFAEALTEFINWAEHWQTRLGTEGMSHSDLNLESTANEFFIRA